MFVRQSDPWRLLLIGFTLTGCGAQPSGEVDEGASGENLVVGSEVVDPKGRRWRITKRVDTDRARLGKPSGLDPTIHAQETLAQMSVEQIAEALRPVAFANGHEFTLAEPDLEMAARIRAELDKPGTDEASAPPPAVGPRSPLVEELQGTAVIGSDERAIRRNNTTYPFRSIVSFSPVSDPGRYDYGAGSCTATLIGPSTAISSAHCFHDGSSWINEPYWMIGVDQQDASSYPYSPTATSYPSYRSGYIRRCYRVTLPSQFVNGTRTIEYDYAVIEFGDGFQNCGYTPGQLVGYLGFWRAGDSTINSSDYYKYIYGYPTGDDFSCAGGQCFWPSIWGIGNNDASAQSNGYVIENDTDATNGESGAAMYVILDGWRYVIGVHKGSQSNFFTLWNVARRVTTPVWNFVQNYSAGVHGGPYLGDSG